MAIVSVTLLWLDFSALLVLWSSAGLDFGVFV